MSRAMTTPVVTRKPPTEKLCAVQLMMSGRRLFWMLDPPE
jgi:hypothetical protein